MNKKIYEKLKHYCMNHKIDEFKNLFEGLRNKEEYLSHQMIGEKEGSDFYQATFLGIAVTVNNQEMLDYLISQGAALDVQTEDGETPLFWAVSMRDRNIVSSLLKAGADANCAKKTSEGKIVLSALHLCLSAVSDRQCVDACIAKDLIEHGADIYTMNEVGNCSPMTEAIIGERWCVLDLLLDAGFDVNYPLNKFNTTLLQGLSQKETNLPYFKKVFELGGDINQTDKYGHDALYYINRLYAPGNVFSKYLEEEAIKKEKNSISNAIDLNKINEELPPAFKI